MFFMGARERMKADKLWGNINMCFVFLFGLFGGVTDILNALGFTMNAMVLAIPNVYLGGLMIICIARLRKNPWTFFALWIFAAFGVFALGLAGLGVMAATLTLIGQVLLGLVAALGTWALIVFIHGYTGTGKKLTLGSRFLSKNGHRKHQRLVANFEGGYFVMKKALIVIDAQKEYYAGGGLSSLEHGCHHC